MLALIQKLTPYLKPASYALVAIVTGWSVYKAQEWRYSSRINAIHAAAATAQANAVKAAMAETVSQQQQAAEIDRAKSQELTNVKSENARLRLDVADGKRRLRVAAQCPAAGGLPGAADRGGLDHARPAQLTPDAEQAYFALIDGLTELEAAHSACAATLRAITRP